jgi:hypothetical protein
MIRVAIILYIAVLAYGAHADELVKDQTQLPVSNVDVSVEKVVVDHDLATHMGWSDQQAVFNTPRNFRSKALNELNPESLEPDSELKD